MLLRTPRNSKGLDDVLDQVVHQLAAECAHLEGVVQAVQRLLGSAPLLVVCAQLIQFLLSVHHLLAELLICKVVVPRKVLVNAQGYPQGVPALVLCPVEAKALQAVQDVVDSGQVHDRINGVQHTLSVVLFLIVDQLEWREHGADHKGHVTIIHLIVLNGDVR